MNRDESLVHLFGTTKPVIGMVHSLPLPGSAQFKHYNLDDVYEFGVDEAMRLRDGGVDGLLLENAGDVPFVKESDIGYETVASMAILGMRVRAATGLPLGIITVANAAIASLAVAHACGASFVRVNQWANAYIANEGLIEGVAGTALRYRSWIGADEVKIFADVHVKHGSHAITADRPTREQAIDVEFFGADVLIASGGRTGEETTEEEVIAIRDSTSLPVIVGSGLSTRNCSKLLSAAHGAVVGSAFKDNGRMHGGRVDVDKVRELVAAVRKMR